MYEGTVEVADLPRLRSERVVTQALLVEGKNRARLYEPSGSPPEGFAPVPVTLEDAYLVLMRLGSLPSRERATGGTAILQRGDGVPGAIAGSPAAGAER
jgi:hypothetical protein